MRFEKNPFIFPNLVSFYLFYVLFINVIVLLNFGGNVIFLFQVLQGGGQEAPTKPKGRPKKSDIASMERTPSSEMEQSDDSDLESVTSPLSGDSSPQRSPMVVDKTPSPKPLMPSL